MPARRHRARHPTAALWLLVICLTALTAVSCTDPIPQPAAPAIERQTQQPDTTLADSEVLRILILIADIELTYEATAWLLHGYRISEDDGSSTVQAGDALTVAESRLGLLVQMLQGWQSGLFEAGNGSDRLRSARSTLLAELRTWQHCLSKFTAEGRVTEAVDCNHSVGAAIDAMYRALWSLPEEQAGASAFFSPRSKAGRLLIDLYLIKQDLLDSCFVTACYGGTDGGNQSINGSAELWWAVGRAETQLREFPGAPVPLRSEQCGLIVREAERPMLRLVEGWADEMRRLWVSRNGGQELADGFRFADNEIARQAVNTYERLLLACWAG